MSSTPQLAPRTTEIVPGSVNVTDLAKTLGWPDDIINDVMDQQRPLAQLIETNIPQIRSHIPYSSFLDVSYHLSQNTVNHTLDDSLIVDHNNGIYIVADGVTREFCKDQDAAWMVAQLFCRLMHWHICEQLTHSNNPGQILETAFIKANEGVAKLNQALGLGADFLESAKGSCAAAVLLRHGEDYFVGNIADCQVVSYANYKHFQGIRDFTPIQTAASEEIRKQQPTRQDMLNVHRACANAISLQGTRERHAYGIINGDPNAVRFFNIRQCHSRTPLMVYSDGFYNLCSDHDLPAAEQHRQFESYISQPELAGLSAQQLILNATLSAPLKRTNKLDDISLILLRSKQ